MDRLYIEEGDLLDHDLRLKIESGEVEPHCAKCKALLEILPPRDEQNRPLHLVRCPTDFHHFQVHFHQRSEAFEELIRNAGKK